MTTSQLNAALGGADVKRVFDVITEALLKDGQVEIEGFGTFELHQQKARKARNPRTGAALTVPAKVVVKFKPTRALKRGAEQLPGVPNGG
jgi:nucleoid DNA-binding protein